MTQLFVTVTHVEEERSATYLFDTFPVRIGRSDSCHLSLCHPSVSRELCTVWIEPDGATIRVEERPNLTTPLLRGRTRVRGGVSAGEVDLRVGPLCLDLRVGAPKSHHNPQRRTRMAVYMVAIVALFGLARFGHFFADPPSHAGSLLSTLPKTPFCGESVFPCDASEQCERKARLAISRARETLSHPGATRQEHIEAALSLTAAARQLTEQGAADAPSATREAMHARTRIIRRYQQNVIRLREGLRTDDREGIHRFARLVLEDIHTCDSVSSQSLEELILDTRDAAAIDEKEDS